ncbi:hypothetical protein N7475_001345 [Penicillium sp. IBT 31633x]|nr:hypothetical protein N7475_001345 [Penicillium sp. IBT 31633x]
MLRYNLKHTLRGSLPAATSSTKRQIPKVGQILYTQLGHTSKNISLIPHTHRGPLSAINHLWDDYEQFLSNKQGAGSRMFAPSFDIRETEDAYHLSGDLPGVQSNDLDIEFHGPNSLSIKGHTEHDSTSNEGSWCVSERSSGDFRRVFNFPSAVNQEKVHASLKDGVLSMTVPKTDSAATTKKVTVNTEPVKISE